MSSLSTISVKVFGISNGLTTSKHAPVTETFRTTQLIALLSDTITPAFKVRSRVFFRFSSMAKSREINADSKVSPAFWLKTLCQSKGQSDNPAKLSIF
jgi:hypothetical protein